MYDVIVIGAGPAGITASIYAKRSNKKVAVFYNSVSNVEKAHIIDNYYGFENGITGIELFEKGIKQSKNLGIEVKKEEVIHLEKQDIFEVKTNLNKYESKVVILAMGNKKITPNIKRITEFEGKGVCYCAICDGFFYRNKNVAVIGNGKYALSEADILKNITPNVTILTNGSEDIPEEAKSFKVNKQKIQEIIGDTKVTGIIFEDGSKIELDGIFIAIGEAGGLDFAKKMGVVTSNNNICVNENMQTNLEGLFACGDLVGGLNQVNKSAYEGAIAGLSAVKYLNSNNM